MDFSYHFFTVKNALYDLIKNYFNINTKTDAKSIIEIIDNYDDLNVFFNEINLRQKNIVLHALSDAEFSEDIKISTEANITLDYILNNLN